jgi:hypothetical protein
MKTPNEVLLDRAIKKQEGKPNEGLKRYRDSAQAQLPETVIDACLFSRPSNDLYNRLAEHGGLIGQFALSRVQKKRSGGFPAHFLLAVTATEVVALRRKQTIKAQMSETGEEVGRWRRSELKVSTKVSTWQRQVTLQPATGPAIQCCIGEHPLSESFVNLLLDPAASHQAVG